MDFTTVTLHSVPADLPFSVEVKEGPRKRKLAAQLEYDPSLNRDGLTGADARWWLVLNENHRVGAMGRQQVYLLLEDWINRGWIVRADYAI